MMMSPFHFLFRAEFRGKALRGDGQGRQKPKPGRGVAGFTLIEVMIAVMIILMVMVGVNRFVTSTIRNLKLSSDASGRGFMRFDTAGGSVVRFSDGETIFQEGDEGLFMYMIISGSVNIRKQGSLVATVVACLEAGEMFGESAIIEHRPRAAAAVAVGDTELACYDRDSFLAALGEDPELALQAMSTLIARLRVTTERLQDLATQHVLDRAEMSLTERAILQNDLA